MAAATKDTGHGASITFGTSALAFHWRKIGKVTKTRGKLDDSDLSNANGNKTYVFEDLAEPGEVEVEFLFDPTAAIPDIHAAAETITITGPVPPGGASAADLEGTGAALDVTQSPEFASNGLQVGTLKIAFDGKTGPTHTPAA